jgi:hypothetical protein
MNSQLGLINVWTQGDWVTKTVALLLLSHVTGFLDGDHHQGAGRS